MMLLLSYNNSAAPGGVRQGVNMKGMGKGRIPNWAKQAAQSDFKAYGLMAWHYYCYDIDWSKPLSKEDGQYLRALDIIIKEHLEYSKCGC